MIECNNKSSCHDLVVIEESDVMRVICKECRRQYFIRMQPIKNVPEPRQYVKLFKRWALQGKDNLFYKYYPQHMGR